MGLSFFAPMFLAGTAALGIPWLIHQIRRPEREPVPFSSLMFVPNIKKEIIERRRIQHILLMLLRMLLFMFLMMAFARPYWSSAISGQEEKGISWHLVLFDRSYSMSYGDHRQKAKDAAVELLDSFTSNDRVGVIAFDETADVLTKHFDPGDSEAGSVQSARQAIDSIEPSNFATDYEDALKTALQEIASTGIAEDDLPEEITIHVISDFYKRGMPEGNTGWKLPSRIELDPIDIGTENPQNDSISDSAVRITPNGQIRIAAKVKNHRLAGTSNSDIPIDVRLVLNDGTTITNTLTVKAGNASQTIFNLDRQEGKHLEGYLEIGDDLLKIDNRRSVVWNPKPQKKVLLVADERSGVQYPSSWFITRALPQDETSPWQIEKATTARLSTAIGKSPLPDIVVLSDAKDVPAIPSDDLLSYVDSGGQLLVLLHSTFDSVAWNEPFLNKIGWESKGLRFDQMDAGTFVMLSRIDFEHPIFYPMQGAQFNDFSQVRFYNHHRLSPISTDQATSKIIARFDASEDDAVEPAIIETSYGRGKILLQTFGYELEWTNLPKSIKFIPLLFETMSYLSNETKHQSEWLVGDTAKSPSNESWEWKQPGGEDWQPFDRSKTNKFLEPGIAEWRTNEEEPVAWADAVHLDTGESECVKIDPQEFLLRFSLSPNLQKNLASLQEKHDKLTEQPVAEYEFGRVFLVLLASFLIVETWYAFHLS